ncbi:DUF559 domain-containing protein [Paenibacillus frigoriresistens]|uniref:DUF559 domain-containing protein n=1 Tax=Paenibacillus alginolyticus TaxID=59839 RepID=UPI0015644624|nr:DUF559 domain-containing protein [Paenibacillus frigoriresistens]NRF89821.1 DUF559 domain-containing protein [Paenibacillus frigoriresistens]
MTVYWKNHRVDSIKFEDITEIEIAEYHSMVLNKFRPHSHCILNSIEEVGTFINSFDNWHEKVESDLEAIVFNEVVKIGLRPMVNPLLKDVVNEELLERPLDESTGVFRLDQVLYVNNHPILYIELDGKQHENQTYTDAQREAIILAVLPQTNLLRISSEEIRGNRIQVANTIKKTYHYVSKRYLITEKYKNELAILDLDYEDVPDLKIKTAIHKRTSDLGKWLREVTMGI